VLPEVVALAGYTKLIVDVTSDYQIDIKLVAPDAEVNQYGNLSEFAFKYTGTGPTDPVTEPVEIDLTPYADKEVSEIYFMGCNSSTQLTIKSVTFVK